MTLETSIAQWGYAVVVLGTLVEGETVLLAAGFLAHRGYLSLPGVILFAFAGSVAGDQIYFHFGRHYGASLLHRRPSWRRAADRARALLGKFETPFVLGFRFLYGFRSLTPVLLGAAGYPVARFAVLNAAGGMLWSASVATAGYLFGGVLETLLGDLHRHELWILAALAAIAMTTAIVRRRRRATASA